MEQGDDTYFFIDFIDNDKTIASRQIVYTLDETSGQKDVYEVSDDVQIANYNKSLERYIKWDG